MRIQTSLLVLLGLTYLAQSNAQVVGLCQIGFARTEAKLTAILGLATITVAIGYLF